MTSHPGIYKTVVIVCVGIETHTFVFDGEIPYEDARQRAMFSMRVGDALRADDVFVSHLKDMTRLAASMPTTTRRKSLYAQTVERM